MSEEIAQRIVYKPHCSKCGAEINEKITYRTIITKESDKILTGKVTEIYPSRCERCGQPFFSIEIHLPEQLPTEFIK